MQAQNQNARDVAKESEATKRDSNKRSGKL